MMRIYADEGGIETGRLDKQRRKKNVYKNAEETTDAR